MPLRMSSFLSLTSFFCIITCYAHVSMNCKRSKKISGFRIFTRLQFLYNILLFQNVFVSTREKRKIMIAF
jgi:hypothetical protein